MTITLRGRAEVIYSQLLAAGVLSEVSGEPVYTAPETSVIVVRDIVVASPNGSTGVVSIDVLSGGVYTVLFRTRISDSGISQHWSGRQVLALGDQILVSAVVNSVAFRVTGYRLT